MIYFLKRRLDCHLLKMQGLVLLALGKRAQALLRFDCILVLLPMDRYALATRAHVLAQINRLGDSIASLQQLIRVKGTPVQQAVAWFNLGYVLQENRQLDEARSAFEKAAELHPCMDRAWYGLALVLIRLGQLHEARQALEKTTLLQPMSPYGWYRLAEVNVALGESEKARKVIDHLRQFEPRVAAQLECDIGLCVNLQVNNRWPTRDVAC